MTASENFSSSGRVAFTLGFEGKYPFRSTRPMKCVAARMLFIGASNELGQPECGLTVQWFGAVRAVVLGGVATLPVTGLWDWCFPELRRAGDHAQSAE